MKKLLSLFLVILLMVACSNEDSKEGEEQVEGLSGTWSGQIESPPVPLEFIVKFTQEDEWKGTLSIPVQNLIDYPLSNLVRNGQSVSFEMVLPQDTVNFEGEIKEDDSIEGTFTQRGQSFPFYLKPGEPAEQEEADADATFLSVETEHGTLKGELVVPEGMDQYPVVLIIPGSGPTDRDGNSPALPGKNNSLKLLAEALVEEGIASVRYSKRGAGENMDAVIAEADLRFDNFIHDAVSWIELLKGDDQFSKVGVVGHSQGALVGLLAAKESGVDVYVSVAGTGKTLDKVLLEQLSEQLPANLLSEAEEILAALKEGKVVEDINQQLYSVFRPEAQQFLISWMAFDPVAEITNFETPTLIVQGTHDLQVSVENADLLSTAKNDAEVLMVEGMNHVLKDAPSERMGNLQTYGDPNLPLAEGLISGIVEFFQKEDFIK
ncbi:alpha/beta hydrolase family protein [Bacillaceae bacterium W0354]